MHKIIYNENVSFVYVFSVVPLFCFFQKFTLNFFKVWKMFVCRYHTHLHFHLVSQSDWFHCIQQWISVFPLVCRIHNFVACCSVICSLGVCQIDDHFNSCHRNNIFIIFLNRAILDHYIGAWTFCVTND